MISIHVCDLYKIFLLCLPALTSNLALFSPTDCMKYRISSDLHLARFSKNAIYHPVNKCFNHPQTSFISILHCLHSKKIQSLLFGMATTPKRQCICSKQKYRGFALGCTLLHSQSTFPYIPKDSDENSSQHSRYAYLHIIFCRFRSPLS